MTQVRLPWGQDAEIVLDLPPNWGVEATLLPPGLAPAADAQAAVAEAIARPSGSPPLLQLARGARRVVILVDDSSRPNPAARVLPPILRVLANAGLQPADVTLIFAVATHRPMTEAEVVAKVGAEVAQSHPWRMHDARSPDLVYKGKTRRGTPVWFNAQVDAAELRILVGALDGHPQAGFGGGYKMILPGCAGAATVGANHLLMPSARQYNLTAMPPEENPMRADLEEACCMLTGRSFLVNSILTPEGGVGQVVAGDPVVAHRIGIGILLKAKGVRIERPFDVVITSSCPLDLDLRQGGKAITSAALAARKDGLILAALRAVEGLGRDALPVKVTVRPALTRLLLKLLGARGIYTLTSRLLQKVPPEERFFSNITLQLLREYKLLCYAPTIFEQSRGKLGRIFYRDRAALMAAAARAAGGGRLRVAVLPKGAGTIVLTGEERR